MFGLFLSKEKRDAKRELRREKIKEKKQEKVEQKSKRDSELEEAEKKIALYSIMDVGQDYRALGYVEGRNKNQNLSKKLICEEAYKLGANAIIGLNLQTEVRVSSGGLSDTKAQKNILNDNFTLKTTSKGVSSNTIYIYTGTAVYLS